MTRRNNEDATKLLVRFSEKLTNLYNFLQLVCTVHVPLAHMIAFNLVNRSRFHCANFLTTFTNLQADNADATCWYVTANLGHIAQKAISHSKAYKKIFPPDHIPFIPRKRNLSKPNTNSNSNSGHSFNYGTIIYHPNWCVSRKNLHTPMSKGCVH